MKHSNSRSFALLASVALLVISTVANADDHAFKEGVVFEVTSIRTVDGMFDDYLTWLAGPWKTFMEAQKKAGVIIDYEVAATAPRGPSDPDLYLITTYKNLGAMDNLDEKTEAMSEKIFGGMQKANADAVGRGKMRTILGSEIVRKLDLK